MTGSNFRKDTDNIPSLANIIEVFSGIKVILDVLCPLKAVTKAMGGKLPTCGNLVVSCAQISTFNLATRSTLKLVSKMWKVWNICCTTGPLKV